MATDISPKKLMLAVGSTVVIVLCGINLVKQITGGPAGFAPTGVQQEVGRELAVATASHLQNAGTVAILAIDDSQSPFPFAKKQVEAATETLEDAGIEVRETVWLMANQILPEMGVMSVGVYLEAMKAHTDVDGIVSLCGIPVPDPMGNARQEVAALRKMPPMFCVTQDRGTLTPMMKSGLIKAAVVEKGTAVDMTDGKAPKKPKEWFVAVYEVITSAPPPPEVEE